jgi:hypothetical protein
MISIILIIVLFVSEGLVIQSNIKDIQEAFEKILDLSFEIQSLKRINRILEHSINELEKRIEEDGENDD